MPVTVFVRLLHSVTYSCYLLIYWKCQVIFTCLKWNKFITLVNQIEQVNQHIKLLLNYVFVYCALESALQQRLGAIKVELEFWCIMPVHYRIIVLRSVLGHLCYKYTRICNDCKQKINTERIFKFLKMDCSYPIYLCLWTILFHMHNFLFIHLFLWLSLVNSFTTCDFEKLQYWMHSILFVMLSVILVSYSIFIFLCVVVSVHSYIYCKAMYTCMRSDAISHESADLRLAVCDTNRNHSVDLRSSNLLKLINQI